MSTELQKQSDRPPSSRCVLCSCVVARESNGWRHPASDCSLGGILLGADDLEKPRADDPTTAALTEIARQLGRLVDRPAQMPVDDAVTKLEAELAEARETIAVREIERDARIEEARRWRDQASEWRGERDTLQREVDRLQRLCGEWRDEVARLRQSSDRPASAGRASKNSVWDFSTGHRVIGPRESCHCEPEDPPCVDAHGEPTEHAKAKQEARDAERAAREESEAAPMPAEVRAALEKPMPTVAQTLAALPVELPHSAGGPNGAAPSGYFVHACHARGVIVFVRGGRLCGTCGQ